jgi:UTP:GlnB (protein PII) uridylyltransferase
MQIQGSKFVAVGPLGRGALHPYSGPEFGAIAIIHNDPYLFRK